MNWSIGFKILLLVVSILIWGNEIINQDVMFQDFAWQILLKRHFRFTASFHCLSMGSSACAGQIPCEGCFKRGRGSVGCATRLAKGKGAKNWSQSGAKLQQAAVETICISPSLSKQIGPDCSRVGLASTNTPRSSSKDPSTQQRASTCPGGMGQVACLSRTFPVWMRSSGSSVGAKEREMVTREPDLEVLGSL